MPDTFHSLQQQRHRARVERKRLRKAWQLRLDKVNALFLISNTLLAIALVVIIGIFGPVLAEETQYQFRSLKSSLSGRQIRSWVIPDWNLNLVDADIAEGNSIVIPKLFIQERIIPNVDPTNKSDYLIALSQGIAHAAGTGLVGSGRLGYYFAHSSGLGSVLSRGKAVFYLLGKLEVGDDIDMYQGGKKYQYQVISKHIVEPDDLSFLEQAGDKIVLQTCWPIGTSASRLIITAEKSI